MSRFSQIMTNGGKPKYGLINEYNLIVLPVIYEYILVVEKGGFVYATIRNEDLSITEEVYEIKEDGNLVCIEDCENTDFIFSMDGGVRVLKIDGKFKLLRDLNKSIW